MKLKLTCLFLGLLFLCDLSAQASLFGTLTHEKSGEPVLYAKIKLYKNGVFEKSVDSNFEGEYFFAKVEPGEYDVEVVNMRYPPRRIPRFVIGNGEEKTLNISLGEILSSEPINIDHIENAESTIYPFCAMVENELTTLKANRTIRKVRVVDPEGEIIKKWHRIYEGDQLVSKDALPAGVYSLNGWDDGHYFECTFTIE